MRINHFILYLLVSFISINLTSCLDYDELRENPNQPANVPPSLIFTGLLPATTESFSDEYKRMQYHIWVSTDREHEIDFREDFDGSFEGYENIRNIQKMNEAAENVNEPVYKILGKFLAARSYIEMTRRMGYIPFSEAGEGAEIPRPAYDSQKAVYIGSLNMLDEANHELGEFIANNQVYSLEGDVYYDGSLLNWQKLINAYTLRILISLSKKSNDSELNVTGRFANIINNPSEYPLFESISDNAELSFSNEDGFIQSYNPDRSVARQAIHYASTYIDLLKDYEDPRLFVVADPAPVAMAANPDDEEAVRANPDSYVGADPTISPAENITLRLNGEFSLPNEEKYWNYVGQPGVWMSYWEQEFCIAEAAHRGWISTDPKQHYDNAIRGSMLWYGVENNQITAYLSADPSKYLLGENGLTRLLEQKYIAFAENSGQEAFFNFRRTNVPDLPYSTYNVGAEPGYPKRWAYPDSENVINTANYLNALVTQFGVESDDIDFIIWELTD